MIATRLGITETEQSEQLANGTSRYENQVAWARFYLSKAGFLDSSKYGVWSLTQKGIKAHLPHDEALKVFREVRAQFKKDQKNKEGVSDSPQSENDEQIDDHSPEVAAKDHISTDHRPELLTILKSFSPTGFEHFCQKLLRTAGFQQVTVTGRSGDGGIDGHGVVEVNPFVSFRVLFQCKRYDKAVSPDKVRDFRGAMAGRADKGIILTTGTFTAEAQREAVRDGVPPIELVNGEKLLEMIERYEFGLVPKRGFEINKGFFEEFI